MPNPDQTDTDGDLAGDACDTPGSGNADCDDKINSVDALKLLRQAAGLPVSQSEPCADIGTAIGGGHMQGDVNCNGAVNSVDALLVLRYVAALPVALPPECPAVGP